MIALSQRASAGAGLPDNPVTTLRVKPRRPLRELEATLLLRSLEPDTPVLCGTWYPEGLLCLAAGMRSFVILAHGSELMQPEQRWRRGAWAELQKRVLEAAQLVVANSRYTRELAQRAAPRARVEALPLAVDIERFSPIGREQARAALGVTDERVVLSVSRIHEYKGHEVVLDAIASLDPAAREKIVYLVAGKGPYLPTLRARAAALGIERHVRWLGFVPESELPNFYRAADLFALCTREVTVSREVEGFGLVFLEAQACGVPVVGARTGGIPDAIAEGNGGFLIEEDDRAALGDLLRRLVADPGFFREEGRRARTRVERHCAWPGYVDALVAMLEAHGISLESSRG